MTSHASVGTAGHVGNPGTAAPDRRTAPRGSVPGVCRARRGGDEITLQGNRGLGRALVDELLDRGAAKLYATSRSRHQARDERIVPLVLDVTNDHSVASAAQTAADLSIVVNNAGLSLPTSVLESPLEDVSSELDTNLFGTIRAARAFAPVLARHDSSALINVLSVLSWYPMGSGYAVSKAAAWSATNSMRMKLRAQGRSSPRCTSATWTPT